MKAMWMLVAIADVAMVQFMLFSSPLSIADSRQLSAASGNGCDNCPFDYTKCQKKLSCKYVEQTKKYIRVEVKDQVARKRVPAAAEADGYTEITLSDEHACQIETVCTDIDATTGKCTKCDESTAATQNVMADCTEGGARCKGATEPPPPPPPPPEDPPPPAPGQ